MFNLSIEKRENVFSIVSDTIIEGMDQIQSKRDLSFRKRITENRSQNASAIKIQ